MIAAAIETLVMAQDQGGDSFAFPAKCRKRAVAVIGVQPCRVGLALRAAMRLVSTRCRTVKLHAVASMGVAPASEARKMWMCRMLPCAPPNVSCESRKRAAGRSDR